MAAYFSPSTCIKRNRNQFTRKIIIIIARRYTEHTEPLFSPTRWGSLIDIQLPEKTVVPVIPSPKNFLISHTFRNQNKKRNYHPIMAMVPVRIL